MKNALISNLFWTTHESLVLDVNVPFSNRLTPNAEIKVTVEMKNMDFFLKLTLILFLNFFIKKLDLFVNFSKFDFLSSPL